MPLRRDECVPAYLRGALLVLAVALGACAPPPVRPSVVEGSLPDASSRELPISGAQRFVIQGRDIDDLKRLALDGSTEAADRLSHHFSFAIPNASQYQHWLLIAAENGSFLGMFRLAQWLRTREDPDDQIRAKFWFTRVAESPAAPEALRTRSHAAMDEISVKPGVSSGTTAYTAAVPSTSDQPVVAVSRRFIISNQELDGVKQVALAGSPDEALRISQYFGFVALDMAQWMYWLTVAAENGSPVGAFNLAQRLRSSDNQEDLLRAKFWYMRVADSSVASESLRARSRAAIDEFARNLAK